MHLEDDLDHEEETWKLNTLNELAHNLTSAFMLETYCFNFLPYTKNFA